MCALSFLLDEAPSAGFSFHKPYRGQTSVSLGRSVCDPVLNGLVVLIFGAHLLHFVVRTSCSCITLPLIWLPKAGSSATIHAAHTEVANCGLFVHMQNPPGTGKAHPLVNKITPVIRGFGTISHFKLLTASLGLSLASLSSHLFWLRHRAHQGYNKY